MSQSIKDDTTPVGRNATKSRLNSLCCIVILLSVMCVIYLCIMISNFEKICSEYKSHLDRLTIRNSNNIRSEGDTIFFAEGILTQSDDRKVAVIVSGKTKYFNIEPYASASINGKPTEMKEIISADKIGMNVRITLCPTIKFMHISIGSLLDLPSNEENMNKIIRLTN